MGIPGRKQDNAWVHKPNTAVLMDGFTQLASINRRIDPHHPSPCFESSSLDPSSANTSPMSTPILAARALALLLPPPPLPAMPSSPLSDGRRPRIRHTTRTVPVTSCSVSRTAEAKEQGHEEVISPLQDDSRTVLNAAHTLTCGTIDSVRGSLFQHKGYVTLPTPGPPPVHTNTDCCAPWQTSGPAVCVLLLGPALLPPAVAPIGCTSTGLHGGPLGPPQGPDPGLPRAPRPPRPSLADCRTAAPVPPTVGRAHAEGGTVDGAPCIPWGTLPRAQHSPWWLPTPRRLRLVGDLWGAQQVVHTTCARPHPLYPHPVMSKTRSGVVAG